MNFTRPLVLASRSPRRKQLIEDLGLKVIIKPTDIDESYPADLDPFLVPEFLANKKADAISEVNNEEVVLTGDTVVILEGEILEKPSDKKHAIEMLRLLSGKKHYVVSGICLKDKDKRISASSVTSVWFKELSDDEIHYYIDNYEPFDKAGAYGIQEWIGMVGVEKIEGSYFNVVGFPVHLIYEILSEFK
ncbi:Maf family protein [Mangrovivirga cuniculi]|uniref:dTTP/UTP pyrophosphatase n=1 Tax=Mangrovivirga cuniculi TaxID=2715131 RepID=A0A4D7JIY3_9BACT|nr:Maf family nucleotide pyrophosphatase [Mangrovivirga cuniculi]QCK15939.1 septum formation protein Maf [Mangrovivirga cuniculi]